MEISNLNFDQVKEKLKNYTYIDLLSLCKALNIQTTELKNGIQMQRSYSKCIESILEYKEYLELEGQNENFNKGIGPNIKEFMALTIPVNFNLIQAEDSFRYFILGNTLELGNWDIKDAVELIKLDNVHNCDIDFYIYDLGNVEYKLIREKDQTFYWEAGNNRKILTDENFIMWR